MFVFFLMVRCGYMDAVSVSLEDTRAFASSVVDSLRRSDAVSERAVVLTLSGPLGSGKTALVRCIAGVLGVSETVVSPTFILRADYTTSDSVFSTLVHIDLYRIEGSAVSTIGWDVVLSMPNTLVAVEWPERASDFLPRSYFSVVASVHGDRHSFSFSSV